jgi:hypothetical protein
VLFRSHQVKQGFVTPKNRALVIEAADPETLLSLMKPQLRINGITNLA